MSKFLPKSHPQIVGAMATKLAAETPITDFTDGSVALTLLEVAAQEDFQQYIQMLNVIRNYNLDTTEGADLDKRAQEYGITRRDAVPHSGSVTISDATFLKISTKVYAGLPGPTAGSILINIDDASTFPASGQLYVGRGTSNSEGPINYSAAPVNNTSYWTITLDTALVNDHGTDESVVLAQGGNRVIEAGTEVAIPETDVSSAVKFELNQTVELHDGENSLSGVLVTAIEPGGFRVPANSVVSFPNSPFTGALVVNSLPFVNGRDQETDQALRDRIRDTIQALAKGTKQAIQTGILGLVDSATNSSVASANIVPPVNLADGPTKVFIDNGEGLEPTLDSIGLETLITTATGGEQFFQLQKFPLVKASVISQNIELFALNGTETLIWRVGTNEETFTFQPSDFAVLGRARASEISEAINNRSILVEARTITDSIGKKIIITPKARANEEIQIDPASTAQSVLNFTELEVSTLKLYKNDTLLTKDGITASMVTAAQPFNLSTSSTTTTDGDITVTPGSRIITKTAPGLNPFKQLINPGDYIKFSSDADSFFIKVQTIVSDTKIILEKAYSSLGGGLGDLVVWDSPQIEIAANGDENDAELISFGPNDFATPSQALAAEVLARVQAEAHLITSALVVNNTKVKFISQLEDSVNSKVQIIGGGAAISMGFCTTSALSGTITTVGGDITVTGVGTAFLSEVQEGQWIKADVDGIGMWTKVKTVENDTILFLEEGYRGADHTGLSASRINKGVVNQGRNKDFTLNRFNGQIELNVPLSAGDNLTAGSINTRAFIDSLPETFDFTTVGATSSLVVAVDGGFQGNVTTGDGSAPYDTFIDTNLIGYPVGLFNGFYIEWLSGANAGQTGEVASYNEITGQLTTTTGFTNPISVLDKFLLCQIITFVNALDFAIPAQATAQEVATAINKQILGGKSETTILNKVRVRTANFAAGGKIQVKGGTANAVLAFSALEQENQLTNLAFVRSRNSDRNGNPLAIGYTLAPGQNLVAIFDGNSLSKTFSINPEIKGTVATVGVGTFSDTGVGAKYTANSYFNDFWIYWTSGANAGSVQVVTGYLGTAGTFSYSDVFPSVLLNPISAGDGFFIVPRTAENVARTLNDLNTTTMSIVSSNEVVGISGDFVQVATLTPGSSGKVFLTGGTANSIGISIVGVPVGSPINDVTTNSKAGLAKGLLVKLAVDGAVTTGDGSIPYDTLIDTSMITSLPSYFTGMTIEFLSGNNTGHKSVIASYNNVTGQIVLATPTINAIAVTDRFRIGQNVYVVDITGAVAPYTIKFNDQTNAPVDVSGFTASRQGAIRDVNGLNFSTVQVEGVDGYKFFTGLIQKTQWTIDGVDRDATIYPGIGAAGTQFEVLTPVLVELKLILDVTTAQGISLSSVSDQVQTAVLEYVNSRGVSDDVILSEIVAAAQSVAGVFDVKVTSHTANVVIADGELARLSSANLIIG